MTEETPVRRGRGRRPASEVRAEVLDAGARILLAERERELRDRSTEPFDWRTYRPTGANAAQRAEAPGTVPNPT